MDPMGGRHQAPGKRRRSKAGGSAARDTDARGSAPVPPATPPQTPLPPPADSLAGTAPLPPAAPTPPPPGADLSPRRASWWVVAQVGALAFVVAAVGTTLTLLDIVVDWREPLAGAALLLAPLLVRQVALRVHRRWRALAVGYAGFFLVAVGGHLAGDPLLPHTVTGFGATVTGVVVAGLGFVLTSRLRARRAAEGPAAVAAGEPAGPRLPGGTPPAGPPDGFDAFGQPIGSRPDGPPWTAPPPDAPPERFDAFGQPIGSHPDGPPWTAPPPDTPPPAAPPPAGPVASGAETAPPTSETAKPPDDSDTDMLPRVISPGRDDDRDGDSLAG